MKATNETENFELFARVYNDLRNKNEHCAIRFNGINTFNEKERSLLKSLLPVFEDEVDVLEFLLVINDD